MVSEEEEEIKSMAVIPFLALYQDESGIGWKK